MESVARQFATNKNCLVIRNGMFSYRWTQIFEMGNIPKEHHVLKARQIQHAPFGELDLRCTVEERDGAGAGAGVGARGGAEP